MSKKGSKRECKKLRKEFKAAKSKHVRNKYFGKLVKNGCFVHHKKK